MAEKKVTTEEVKKPAASKTAAAPKAEKPVKEAASKAAPAAKTEEKPAAPKAAKAETKKALKVTLVRSTNGCLKNQKATVAALGLRKIRQEKIHPDNPAMRGMVFKVRHLVKVEEITL